MIKQKLYYVIGLLLIIFSFLLGFSILRTLLLEQPKLPAPCNISDFDYIPLKRGLAQRFSKALSIQTITSAPHTYVTEELIKFRLFLEREFPRVHKSPLVKRELVANYSLLYTVHGSDPKLKPYLITAHMDVVPVDESRWTQKPFGGRLVDGFLYGRGAIDDKHIVMGVMEALEFLLDRNFKPKRGFYIAFGHDEEALGLDGAQTISKVLQSRNVSIEFLIDEGMPIMNDTYPGVENPVALVGVSEKGYLTLELSVEGPPGHSSMPRPDTPIYTLAKALSRLGTTSHPSMFGSGPEKETFQSLAPYADFPYRIIYYNTWLFGQFISWFLSSSPAGNSMIRTTTAVTIIKGGVKANVIPSSAMATVNHRVHPAQKLEEVVNFDRELINDPSVQIKVVESLEPLPISPHSEQDFGYQTIRRTYHQIYPSAPVIPTTMIANTDTHWYLPLTSAIYRCSPINLLPTDTLRIHGDDERISLLNLEKSANFYYHLMLNADRASLPPAHDHSEL